MDNKKTVNIPLVGDIITLWLIVYTGFIAIKIYSFYLSKSFTQTWKDLSLTQPMVNL
ncbi:MAG: hypothetical protein LBE37_05975 [Sphingobacterium sp.]|nr:hypothetical protein [Sphingobacterium sp.]